MCAMVRTYVFRDWLRFIDSRDSLHSSAAKPISSSTSARNRLGSNGGNRRSDDGDDDGIVDDVDDVDAVSTTAGRARTRAKSGEICEPKELETGQHIST